MGVNICSSAHLSSIGPLKPQKRFFIQRAAVSGIFLLVPLGKDLVSHSFCNDFPLCHHYPGNAGLQDTVRKDFSWNFIRIYSRQDKSNNILGPRVSEVRLKLFKMPTLMYLLEQFYIIGLSCGIPHVLCLHKKKSLEKE